MYDGIARTVGAIANIPSEMPIAILVEYFMNASSVEWSSTTIEKGRLERDANASPIDTLIERVASGTRRRSGVLLRVHGELPELAGVVLDRIDIDRLAPTEKWPADAR